MLTEKEILSVLEKYCELDEDLCEGSFYDKVVRPLELSGKFNDWTYDSGVSKGVLIFGELDFVIKIPFYCEWIEEEGFYNSQDEWVCEYDAGPSGCPFCGVEVEGYCHKNPWDYCETEAYRYFEAQKQGMEGYFAKTWFIGEVNGGWPIYAQTRANMYYSADSYESRSRRQYSDGERDTVKSIQNATRFYVDDIWLMDFVAYYGEEELKNFILF